MALSPVENGMSVLASIASAVGNVPRVLLRDTDGGDEPPLVRPGSNEMPPRPDPASRYQLLGEIARGGMGAVLKGRDTDLGRDLAVKVLLEQHRDQPDLVRRFVEEAQIGGQLQHPGHRAGLRAGHVRRPAAVLHDEAGQGPDARRPARRATGPTARPDRGSWGSSSRSARRWPTPTPEA